MALQQDSSAVKLARAHAEAWSHHDWDTARKMLAPDVHITAMSTEQGRDPTDTIGREDYMQGLIQFASAIEPGSAQVIASIGDERNSLILLAVKASFGPSGPQVTIPAARLALFDENQQLKKEQVVFFAVPD